MAYRQRIEPDRATNVWARGALAARAVGFVGSYLCGFVRSRVILPRAPAPPARATLDDARAAADAGRLEDARIRANAVHAAGERSVELFHLLGTLEAALGRPAEAEGWLRQAVYLAPSHPEALVQLALLADARGEHELAARYRARAARSTP